MGAQFQGLGRKGIHSPPRSRLPQAARSDFSGPPSAAAGEGCVWEEQRH